VSVHEVKPFLGVIINVGLIPLPDIKSYWSSERKTQVTFFGDIMSRDHLLQIIWMMHVGSDTTQESNQAIERIKNVHGVIEHIQKQFQKTLCQVNALQKMN
jgi:hypothetical protein